MKRILTVGALCAIVVLLPGCKDEALDSAWRGDRAIVIDGKKGDWNGIGVYSYEDEKVFLGIANDEESLYLLVVAQGRAFMMQGLTRGLRIRFRPEDTKRNLWIGCPKAAGFMPGRMGPGEYEGSEGPGGGRPRRFDLTQGGSGGWGGSEDPDDEDRPGGDRQGSDPETGERGGPSEEMMQKILADLPKELEIFTQVGGDSLRLSWAEAARRGVEQAIGLDEGYMVLEMKIPLHRSADHPHAVGLRADALALDGNPKEAKNAKKAATVEIHFKIPKIEMGEMHGGRPGGESEGGDDRGPGHMSRYDQGYPGGGGFPGGGPGGGGPGGMGGGPPGGMRAPSINGLDLTVRARLSGGAS